MAAVFGRSINVAKILRWMYHLLTDFYLSHIEQAIRKERSVNFEDFEEAHLPDTVW